jgi:hypothetical protein
LILPDSDLVALATLEFGMRSAQPGQDLDPESSQRFEQWILKEYPDSPVADRVRELIRRDDFPALLARFATLGAHARVNA